MGEKESKSKAAIVRSGRGTLYSSDIFGRGVQVRIGTEFSITSVVQGLSLLALVLILGSAHGCGSPEVKEAFREPAEAQGNDYSTLEKAKDIYRGWDGSDSVMYAEGVELLRAIPKGSPAFADAQKLIAKWTSEKKEIAVTRAEAEAKFGREQPKADNPLQVAVRLATAQATWEYQSSAGSNQGRLRIMIGLSDPSSYDLQAWSSSDGVQWRPLRGGQNNDSLMGNPVLSRYFTLVSQSAVRKCRNIRIKVTKRGMAVSMIPEGREAQNEWIFEMDGNEEGDAWVSYSSDSSSIGP